MLPASAALNRPTLPRTVFTTVPCMLMTAGTVWSARAGQSCKRQPSGQSVSALHFTQRPHTPHPTSRTHAHTRSQNPDCINALDNTHVPDRAEGSRPALATLACSDICCFVSLHRAPTPPPPSGLHLNSNGLTGTLPSSISSLSTLRVAYFHENGLTGSIPATLPAINLLEARHRSRKNCPDPVCVRVCVSVCVCLCLCVCMCVCERGSAL